jgi:TatD DNase family protein
MKLFDSHCHLDDQSFDKDLETVIKNAQESGVEKMMVAGVTQQSAHKAIQIAKKYDGIYAAVGVHPHDAKACSATVIDNLRALAQNPKVRAWGETGLDFNRMFSPQTDQERWFIEQIKAAADLGLPLILHERDSKGRFAETLKKHLQPGQTGVVHCFSGSADELKSYLEMGLYIGITGILTVKSRGADLRQMVPTIPLKRLLIETDAPYLTPTPQRNRFRRNEPAFVRSVFERLVQVLSQAPEKLAPILWENTCRLFAIRP